MIRWLRDLFLDLRNGLRAARRQRLLIESVKAADAAYLRDRPRIVRVGQVDIHADGQWGISGDWQFWFPTQPHEALAYPLTRDDLDGTHRLYGYTLAEYQQFHARRVEFNIDA